MLKDKGCCSRGDAYTCATSICLGSQTSLHWFTRSKLLA
jgi:hypothetical protein